MAKITTGWTVRVFAGVLGAMAAAAVVPTGAQACSIAALQASPVVPAENASVAPTADGVPVQVRFGPGPDRSLAPVEFSVARLKSSTLPQPVSFLPADIGTVVETVALTYDSATGSWRGSANRNGWARSPGEYVWRVAGTQHFTPPPPIDGGGISSCASLPPTVVHDGRWVHRLTVLRAGKLAIAAGKARDGRVKVRGRVARTFPGKVRLTVACPGARERTTFVAATDGRWQRTMRAKRGCTVKAAIAAREGWAASETSVRVT